jgi:hypothetical protein
MGTDFDKAVAFVERLWANPTMRGFSALQKEDQLIQFLNVNGSKLYPTLCVEPFFPGQNWGTIYQFLMKALNEIADRELMPDLSSVINTEIDLSFTSFMQESRPQESSIRAQLLKFTEEMCQKPDCRRSLTGPYTAIKSRMIERYLERIFDRQKYISFELRKVQKLRMGQEEMTNLIKISLLLRPAVYFFSSAAGMAQESAPGTKAGIIKSQFSERAIQQLSGYLNLLPPDVLRSSINSNLSFLENNFIETTARLVAILAHRCANWKADMKIDRGAEASDISWYNIARRNFRYYGFDLDMLNELYNIAVENGW